MNLINEDLKKLGKMKMPADSLNSHRFKERGQNRQNLYQVPDSARPENKREPNNKFGFVDDQSKGVQATTRVIDIAKRANTGIWKVSLKDVVDIARKYKFNVPNDAKPMKHLGSTGIKLIRLRPGLFYLYKPKKQHYKRRRSKVDPFNIGSNNVIRGIN